jgi:DnaJ-class molecular chaperone
MAGKVMGSLCPDCDGTGSQWKSRKIKIDGEVSSDVVEEMCKRCGGTGHVK